MDYNFNRPVPIKKVECGICKGSMSRHLTKDKTEYWKCNECGAETWPELKDDTPEKIGLAARKVFKESTSGIMKPKSKKSGGSRTKRRKKPVKPIPVSQRFKLE